MFDDGGQVFFCSFIPWRDNYVVLRIFYGALQLDVTQQEPAYGLFSLVGE